MHRHRTFYTIGAVIFVAIIMLGLSAYKQQDEAIKTVHYHESSVISPPETRVMAAQISPTEASKKSGVILKNK